MEVLLRYNLMDACGHIACTPNVILVTSICSQKTRLIEYNMQHFKFSKRKNMD